MTELAKTPAYLDFMGIFRIPIQVETFRTPMRPQEGPSASPSPQLDLSTVFGPRCIDIPIVLLPSTTLWIPQIYQ